MSDVDLLREAATKMRERAEWASPGPWETNDDDGLVWPNRLGDPVCAPGDMADSRHIASWDPTVALAVAKLLERAIADHIEDTGVVWTDCPLATDAVTIARAFLRSGS